MGSNQKKRSSREKEVIGYFIISKLSGEIYVGHMFETEDKAWDWADKAMLRRKLFTVKKARSFV